MTLATLLTGGLSIVAIVAKNLVSRNRECLVAFCALPDQPRKHICAHTRRYLSAHGDAAIGRVNGARARESDAFSTGPPLCNNNSPRHLDDVKRHVHQESDIRNCHPPFWELPPPILPRFLKAFQVTCLCVFHYLWPNPFAFPPWPEKAKEAKVLVKVLLGQPHPECLATPSRAKPQRGCCQCPSRPGAQRVQ